ncbi:MAG TPA: lamin tail domain-containing protein [Aggregatilinea sp.]|uniref:lamin tail domain-containing protein n=1 Tax=Aggregatilinea sp. TaxID=2806333 RepID=UPI002BEDCB34|nr:lamin tail domain-containing protein [Aggregatilinea sp.]HML24483.1 lamin tail domain-containing protein [Aggregatilinea sp.]
MSRRVLFGFILLNVIVSLAVAFVLISYDRSRRPEVEPLEGPTQVIIVSETPVPGSANIKPDQYVATISAQQLTIAALSQATPIVATAQPSPDVGEQEISGTPILATIDPALLPPIPTDGPAGEVPVDAPLDATGETEAAADDGCLRYTVQAGDVIGSIADEYGVFPGDLMSVNGIGVDDFIQIGQVLVIPNEGCTLMYTPTPVPTATNTPFPLQMRAATVTLGPTAAQADVEISAVLGVGDVNNEAVELHNDSGSAINLEGWTLSSDGVAVFEFPEFRMRQDSRVRIFTRQGTDTPAALYWGRDDAAWAVGETLTLSDAEGSVQATFEIEAGS